MPEVTPGLAGRSAVPFALEDPHGRTFRLEDFAGAWLLLTFHRHLA